MEWSEGGEWDNCNSILNKYIKKRKKKINLFMTKQYYKYSEVTILRNNICSLCSIISLIFKVFLEVCEQKIHSSKEKWASI